MGEDINPSLAASIGRKFGAYAGEREGGKGGSRRIAIASDTRTSSQVLKYPVITGLISSGCTVYDLGFSSTPSVFKEVATRKLDGGLVVTASHNPPEWNGIKFVLSGGRGVFEDELLAILSSSPQRVPMKQGRLLRQRGVYEEILMNKAGRNSAQSVSVGVDLAGGVGSLFIPGLLSYQGCEVHSLHDSPGSFPESLILRAIR